MPQKSDLNLPEQLPARFPPAFQPRFHAFMHQKHTFPLDFTHNFHKFLHFAPYFHFPELKNWHHFIMANFAVKKSVRKGSDLADKIIGFFTLFIFQFLFVCLLLIHYFNSKKIKALYLFKVYYEKQKGIQGSLWQYLDFGHLRVAHSPLDFEVPIVGSQ